MTKIIKKQWKLISIEKKRGILNLPKGFFNSSIFFSLLLPSIMIGYCNSTISPTTYKNCLIIIQTFTASATLIWELKICNNKRKNSTSTDIPR